MNKNKGIRLKDDIRPFLKNEILSIAPDAKVLLFGSRTDIHKKGGDIDILILSNSKLSFNELTKIRTHFYDQSGEQKIDLVNFTFDQKDNFKELTLSNAIEL